MPAPFPWSSLPRVDRRTARLATALTAYLRRGTHVGGGGYVVRMRGQRLEISRQPRRGTHVGAGVADLGIEGVRLGAIGVMGGRRLEGRLGEAAAGVVRVRAAGGEGYVVVPGLLARTIAQAVLGGPDELGAPRPLTVAERAVLVVAVAAVVEDAGANLAVEECGLGAPQLPAVMGGEAAVVELDVEGTVPASALVVLPLAAALAAPRLGLGELAEARPAGLEAEVTVPVVLARARVARANLARLRPRDVLVATRDRARGVAVVPVGRGEMTVALAPADGRVTVLTRYARGTMDETLGDDATVEVAVAVGDLRMTVRALLELAPGQILELGRPLGSQVELRVGTRLVARGELVDVDGDVGVRVQSIEPLSANPPAC